ncbi:hypothetical protein GCM10009720_09380 [Yaniella flava]|uniref:Uncharacterized protein n=1 Tax=Yaniella flava TaxID=287930 RepID=A0ABN2UER9_9MICC
MSNQTRTKREYFEPGAVEASIIAAAASMTGPNDHADWNAQMLMNIREVATMARDWKFRDTVNDLLSEDATPFAAIIRGFEFHESSQRYVIQLESKDKDGPKLEYINTNRVDSDASVDLLMEIIEDDLMGNSVLVYKLVEAKGEKKYRSLGHVKNLGPGDDSEFSDQELEDDLLDHVESIGKAQTGGRRR